MRLATGMAFLAVFALFLEPGVSVADPQHTWNNLGGDGLWTNSANWSGGAVPSAGDDVIFTSTVANCTADLILNNLKSITLATNYTGTLTLKSNCVEGANILSLAGDLVVNGGTLVCEGDTNTLPNGAGIIINATNVVIGVGGKISANGQGFSSDNGPGKGTTSSDWPGGGGGGHGGRGGHGAFGYAGGTNYGSAFAPVSIGSGGSRTYSGNNGGRGGGAIKVSATGSITIDGIISADGAAGSGKGAGGSGGSLWLIAGSTLAGIGTISAKGGNGSNSGEGHGSGGGGGGRIKISYGSRTFSGTITAKGGLITTAGGEIPGYPGTLSMPDFESITATADFALPPGTYNIPTLVVTNGATLGLQSDPATTSGTTVVSVHIIVAPGSSISGDGQGFGPCSGPGKGGATADWPGGGGGGHGGAGGDGVSNPGSGGQTNDYETAPVFPGSGGGGGGYNPNTAGYGGGAMRLTAYGAMTINGTVSANGEDHITAGGGGGSGGSIWIHAQNLIGTGVVSAIGGHAPTTGNYGGSGGGGRIAIEYTYYASNLTISVAAGSGSSAGQSGTVFYKFVPSAGTLLIVR